VTWIFTLASIMEQPPNHSDAPRYLVTSGIFTAIALALCAARLYTKFRRTRRLDPDDYTIGVSLVNKSFPYFPRRELNMRRLMTGHRPSQ
jgi:hypothetical protein